MKHLNITFLLFVLIGIISTKVQAHDIEVKNADGVTIYYIWTNNQTELAVSYRGEEYDSYSNEYIGTVVIPEFVTYNGNSYTVTSIGRYAFSYCSGLTSITIPNSVTSIGTYAFIDCTGLSGITIPNSVRTIIIDAFSGCYFTQVNFINNTNLTSSNNWAATICEEKTDGLLIQGNTIVKCRPWATSITIPNSVTSIGRSAFIGCIGLTSVTIPNSVTSIDNSAFYGCKNLSSLIINSNLNIKSNAFNYCHLKDIIVNASPSKISETAFSQNTYNHATLYVPIGTWQDYVYNNQSYETYWYQFLHIREIALDIESLSNSRVYTLMRVKGFDYLVYDAINNRLTTKPSCLDDSPNYNWQIVEKDNNCYLYNLGARKYVLLSPNGELALSEKPVAITMKTSDNGITIGSDGNTYAFIVNDYLNVDYMVASIEPTTKKSVIPNNYYSIDGQNLNSPQKGLNIIRMKDGTTKKVWVK